MHNNPMQLQLNGENHTTSALTLGALLKEQGIDPTTTNGVAVARNGQVVPRTEWDVVVLLEGDSLEIITAMAGG